MHKKIILASQSPRRKQLLQQAEIEFDVVVMHTDESFPLDLAVDNVPEYIAKGKAIVVALHHPNHLIIAADTVVVLNNKIIGKPKDEADAIEILQKLSGNTHQVITGVCMLYNNTVVQFSSTTKVHFNTLSTQQIMHYVSQYKPYDKAGAYAIQEYIGAVGISSIEGDYYNVMGLPINKVVSALAEWDFE
jgi:septum formation protein